MTSLMKKRLIIIFLLIISFFFYHSPVLSANNPEPSKKWEDLEFKKLAQPKNIFSQRIDQVLSEPQASLLNGMIFGVKGAIPKDFFNELKRTGVLHIIALSGTNISILVNAIFVILTPLLGRRKACLFAIFLIIIFIWFVGPSASVVRAGIMGTISLLAGYFGRQYWGVLSLIMAVAIMFLVSPKVIGDIGFQLSVMATLGIMLLSCHPERPKGVEGSRCRSKNGQDPSPSTELTPSGIERLGIGMTIRKAIENNLKITLAAQVFTLPIIIVSFGEISLVSPLTNILISAVVPVITTGGLLAAILVVLIKPIGVILLWSLWVLLSYFVAVVKLTSLIPLASINVPKMSWGIGVLYYLIVLWFILRKKVKIIF